ncbi:hypothetical protein [Deinococcus navajonensis]|uniref:Uncharacterized protein n=1 Tax=Deinococcus navajonensis TaxID=309884 RepID=A0ABV8XRN2_9DEIO
MNIRATLWRQATSEAQAVALSDAPRTRRTLAADLQALRVEAGDVLLPQQSPGPGVGGRRRRGRD